MEVRLTNGLMFVPNADTDPMPHSELRAACAALWDAGLGSRRTVVTVTAATLWTGIAEPSPPLEPAAVALEPAPDGSWVPARRAEDPEPTRRREPVETVEWPPPPSSSTSGDRGDRAHRGMFAVSRRYVRGLASSGCRRAERVPLGLWMTR